MLSDNLISYLTLDIDATDSANQINGAITGSPVFQAGKINNGAKFSGTGQYITMANSWQSLSSFSMSLWVKASATNSTEKYFTRDQSGGTNWGFYVGQNGTSGKYQCGVQLTGAVFHEFDSNLGIDTANLKHLVLTYDGTTCIYYTQGILDASVVFSAALADQTNKSLILGGLNATTQLTTALLDEVGFWGRALTPRDIQELYNNGNGLQYPFHDIGFANAFRTIKVGGGMSRSEGAT